MHRVLASYPLKVVAVLWLCLCAHAAQAQQSAPDSSGPDTTIAVGDDAVSDAQIARRIDEVLGQMDGYGRITVSVASGVVTLRGEVIDGAARDELLRIVGRVAGVVAIETEISQSGDLNERLAPAVDRLIGRGESVLVNTPIFLVALGTFAGISALGWLVTTRLTLWNRLAPNSFIADIYRAIARTGFVILGLVIALDILNATALLGAVLGAAGVVGLALGFAVRDTVENFIASVLLSLRQPFRPNDFVEIEGEIGNVARLTSRATLLISPDGNHVRIPNATVFKGKIVNYSRNPTRRFSFDLGVDPDSDLAAALSTASDAIQNLPFVLSDPPVGAWIKDVGDSNVVLTLTGWVNQQETDFLKARGEAIRVSKTALEAAGFALPEPVYRLRVDGAATALPAAAGTDPARPKATPPAVASDLPPAAAPEMVEQAIEDVADRERLADDGATDLLSDARKAE